jgi:hypothetical protein
MSWNGTVRCGWCSSKGHNKTSCLSRKKWIQENPNSHAALSEERKAERRAEIQAKGGRKCSYCSERGHTTRTCPTKKTDRISLEAALMSQRAELLEMMQSTGWMVGALHNWVSRWDQGGIYLLKSIGWTSAVDLQTTGLHFVNVAKMSGGDDDPYGYRSARKTINLNLEAVKDKKPLGAGTILNPPAGWSEGWLYKEEEFFEKGKPRARWARNLENGLEINSWGY